MPRRPPGPPLLGSALRTLPGEWPCSEADCRAATGMRCEFVDRRGRRCDTAWCPQHRLVADAEVLCRRHASVRAALAALPSGDASPAPDVDVRCPALVNWVSFGIDRAVRTLLGAPDTEVVSGPVWLHVDPAGRGRSWLRCWNGAAHTVCLGVGESEPAEVAVLVDGGEVVRLIPPWIADRGQGASQAARRRFCDSVLRAVSASVAPPR
ncbi:MAG: hypothetical protein ACYDAC_07815 [Candidatus Dormibacteria bacterium]